MYPSGVKNRYTIGVMARSLHLAFIVRQVFDLKSCIVGNDFVLNTGDVFFPKRFLGISPRQNLKQAISLKSADVTIRWDIFYYFSITLRLEMKLSNFCAPFNSRSGLKNEFSNNENHCHLMLRAKYLSFVENSCRVT